MNDKVEKKVKDSKVTETQEQTAPAPALPDETAPAPLSDPTVTTTDANGTIRTAYVAPEVVHRPTINVVVQTGNFADLVTELKSLCAHIDELDGTVPANFTAQLADGNSYVNYYFS